jgi:hypothetical protein
MYRDSISDLKEIHNEMLKTLRAHGYELKDDDLKEDDMDA